MSFYTEIKLGNKEKVLAVEKESENFDFNWFVVMAKKKGCKEMAEFSKLWSPT